MHRSSAKVFKSIKFVGETPYMYLNYRMIKTFLALIVPQVDEWQLPEWGISTKNGCTIVQYLTASLFVAQSIPVCLYILF